MTEKIFYQMNYLILLSSEKGGIGKTLLSHTIADGARISGQRKTRGKSDGAVQAPLKLDSSRAPKGRRERQ